MGSRRSMRPDGLDAVANESVPISEVITLLNRSASLGSDIAEKDAISADLNIKFENLDKVLDATVRENEYSFKESIENFAAIAADVTDAQDKVEELRTALISCKQQLTPRREYFLQLWGTTVELNETLRLLDLMDDVCKVSDQAHILCGEKQFYLAALLLSRTLHHIDNDLQDVGALSEKRQAVLNQKTALYDVLIDQLHTQLYMKWRTPDHQANLNLADNHTQSDLWGTIGSDAGVRESSGAGRHGMGSASGAKTASSRLTKIFLQKGIYTPRMKRYLDDVVEISAENSQTYTGTLIEALRVLGRLDDTLETIKQRLKRELTGVTVTVVQEVNRKIKPKFGSSLNEYRKKSVANQGSIAWGCGASLGDAKRVNVEAHDNQTSQQKDMMKILDLLLVRLQHIFETHVWTLDMVKAKCANSGLGEFQAKEVGTGLAPAQLMAPPTLAANQRAALTDRDVWLAIQNEVQEFLEEYLGSPQNISSKMRRARGFSLALEKMDINQLFSKETTGINIVAQAQQLFQFSASTYAVNSDPNKRENLVGSGGLDTSVGGIGMVASSGGRKVICDPSPLNFTCCYGPVIAFCKEMEARCLSASVDKPPLQRFMTNFGEVQFLQFIRSESMSRLKVGVEDPDAFAVVSGLNSEYGGSPKSLLVKSVVVVERIQDDLQSIVRQLPEFKQEILEIMCDLLKSYKSSCDEVYNAIMAGKYGVYVNRDERVEQKIVSNEWIKDVQLDSVARQYPSWNKIKGIVAVNIPVIQGGDEDDVKATNKSLHTKQFKIENDLLSNLVFRKTNIITHVGSFTTLACMHQSLEWLANKISVNTQSQVRRMSVNPFQRAQARQSIKELAQEKNDNTLFKCYHSFQGLSDQCLLALKMEVRCQVYYYLIIVLQKSVYFLEEVPTQPDPNVMLLNDALSSIEDAIGNYLPTPKIEFIFDQVAELMCSVLMTYIDQIKKINTKGVTKMYYNIHGLKQNLTNITSTYNTEFVKAIGYYELLNLSPKEIVDRETRDNNPQFTLDEFIRLFYVIHHSSPATEAATINEQIGRLKKNFDVKEKDRAKRRRRASTIVRHPNRRPSLATEIFTGLGPP
eukprot:CFRG1802T1